jgi:hypothetical protein
MLRNDDSLRRRNLLRWLGHKGDSMPRASVTAADIEKFHRRAEVCRAEAEMTWEPGRQQERLDTALAYERMAERAKRHIGLTE